MQDRFSFSGHIFSSMDEDYTPPPSTPTSAPANPTQSTPSSFTPSNPGASPSPTPTPPSPTPSSVPAKPKVHNGLASYKEGYTYEEKQIFDQVLKETMDIYDVDTLNRCLALNEAEQNSLLISLTNKLYQMLVE